MKHVALGLLLVLLAGCCTEAEFTRPPSTGEPWDLTYLIDADPSSVSVADLTSAVVDAEGRLTASMVDGVVWSRTRSSAAVSAPDVYGTGGDSALFTGVALATWAWKHAATGESLAQLDAALSGVELLINVTGQPGVIARCALPLDQAAAFGWPWAHREPFVGEHDGYGYYTRATRDQLTGLVFGLAVAWAEVPAVRPRVADLADQLIARLEADDWHIRDENGANDTGADGVDGILRLGLEALDAVANGGDTAGVADRLRDLFGDFAEAVEAWINRFSNYDGYFAYHLRALRCATVFVLASELAPGDAGFTADLRDYAQATWWRYVDGHRSAWFDGVWMLISGEDRTAQALYSLQSLSLRPSRGYGSPYAGQEQTPSILDALVNCTEGLVVDPHLRKPTGYTTWQKEPWDVGEHPDSDGLLEDTGLALTSGYWLYRRAGP